MTQLKLASFGVFGYGWCLFLSSQYLQIRFLDFFNQAYIIGIILSIHSIFGIVVIPLTNKFSERLKKRKPILIISAIGISISLMGIIVDSQAGIIFFTITFYLSFVIYEGVYHIFFSEQAEDQNMISLHFSVSEFLSGIFLFLFGSIILKFFSWNTSFKIIFGASSIILLIFHFIPIFFVSENFNGENRSKERRKSMFPILPKNILKERRASTDRRKKVNLASRIKLFCIICGLYFFAIGIFHSYHSLFFKKALNLSNNQISNLMLLVVFFNFIGLVIIYFIYQKIKVNTILLICTIGLILTFPFFYFTSNYHYLICLSILIGLFLGGLQTQLFTIINNITPKGQIEKSISSYLIFSHLGTFTSEFFIGFFIDYLNDFYGNVSGYYSIYLIITLSLILSLILLKIWEKKFF